MLMDLSISSKSIIFLDFLDNFWTIFEATLYFFSRNMACLLMLLHFSFPLFLRLLKRKVVDLLRTKIINFFRLFWNFVCLYARLQTIPVYVEAWNIYWKYGILSKIILTWSDFSLSRLFIWAIQEHFPMFEKNITKMNGICV